MEEMPLTVFSSVWHPVHSVLAHLSPFEGIGIAASPQDWTVGDGQFKSRVYEFPLVLVTNYTNLLLKTTDSFSYSQRSEI